MTILKVQPLDAAAFEPFGQVLAQLPDQPARYNFAAQIFTDRPAAKPNLRVQRTDPTPLPLLVRQIERHPHSSQTFAPISGGRYLAIVFPSRSDGWPLVDEGIAFAANGDQAINYNRGTWHHGFTALDAPGTFLMLRWEDGTAIDEEYFSLGAPIRVEP